MLPQLNGETLLYPILGDPIRFVKSPHRLTARFEELRHNGICAPMQLPEASLGSFVRAIRPVANIAGLLVTMPHKNAMFNFCATASETSRLLRVVSVVRRNPDGSWHGDVLDGTAFVAALQKAGSPLQGARVLQIGAGGAGSAIAIALLDAGVRTLVLHDADPSRRAELLRLLSGSGRSHVVSGPPDPSVCDIVINATPMGMSPDDPLPVPAATLASSMFVGDVVAGHGPTPLLQAAQAAGCRTVDGSAMVDAGIELMLRFFLKG